MKNKTRQNQNRRARKFTTVVIRGCVMRIAANKAETMRTLEAAEMRHDWSRNRVD